MTVSFKFRIYANFPMNSGNDVLKFGLSENEERRAESDDATYSRGEALRIDEDIIIYSRDGKGRSSIREHTHTTKAPPSFCS